MRELIRKKFFNFTSDRYCWISCIFAVALLCFHLYQFIESDYRIEPLIRIIYCGVYPFFILFLGRDSILFLFLFFALTLEQFTDFSNYTAFFIIVFFLFVHPAFMLPVLIVYALDVIAVCEHHDKSVIHLTIHFINCGFIFIAAKIIFNICAGKIKASARKLILDEADLFILSELSKGAKQKEIEGYSENTVSKRLKKMREKNYIETNHELLMRFIQEIQ